MDNIAIIGGGASGAISAIFLLRKGHKVTIFEKNNRLCKKVDITGNGRCNISNQNLSSKYFYSSTDKKHIKSIINRFNTQDTIKFFESLSIELKISPNGRIYPSSNQASTISQRLKEWIKILKADVFLNTTITQVDIKNEKFIIQNKSFDKLIIATGSQAMPKLGSCSIGYDIAKSFGHTISPLFPSLVQLKANDKNLHIAKGVKTEAKIIFQDISFVGDILFTDYGLSGSAILDISRFVSSQLLTKKCVTVNIDLFPNNSIEQIVNRFNKLYNPSLSIESNLNGILNIKLVRYLIKRYAILTLSKKMFKQLAYQLKSISFEIYATKGFDNAEVSAGGVVLDELSKNLESLKHKNLFFIGEIVDVDGACGGYNLQWAISSASVVNT